MAELWINAGYHPGRLILLFAATTMGLLSLKENYPIAWLRVLAGSSTVIMLLFFVGFFADGSGHPHHQALAPHTTIISTLVTALCALAMMPIVARFSCCMKSGYLHSVRYVHREAGWLAIGKRLFRTRSQSDSNKTPASGATVAAEAGQSRSSPAI